MRLEPLSLSHLPDVSRVTSVESVVRYTGFPWPAEEGFADAWFARYEAGRRDGTKEAFAAMEETGFVGLALAVHIDREAAEVELGYLVAPEAQGRGIATAMLDLLTTWTFEATGAQRISLLIDIENEASRRVAHKVGYQREGVLRSRYLKPGRRADSESWSLLSTDPRPTAPPTHASRPIQATPAAPGMPAARATPTARG